MSADRELALVAGLLYLVGIVAGALSVTPSVDSLIPQWLSVWGLVGVLMAVLASLLVTFGVTEVRSTAYVGLTLPIAVQETVLAIWLITNGLTP